MRSSIRSTLVRRPWLYWIGAAIVASLAGWLIHVRMADLDAARATWGDSRGVLVTVHDHDAGDTIDAQRVELPLGAIPPSALNEVEPGAEARHDLAAGEIVVESDVAVSSGPGALAPVGTLTIGVRERMPSSIVAVGSRAQIFAEGIRLSGEARVVAVAEDVIFVAVPERDAASVAAAAHADLATVAYEP